MWQSRPCLSRLLIVVVLAIPLGLGVFFRVTHIDKKVYWWDETYTFLSLSATDPATLSPEWFGGREVSAADILVYQEICPERGVSGTIRALAATEAQQPPGYVLLAWLLGVSWGTTALPARILSVVFGLLILPGMYWLCREAFADRRAAWLGTVLVAASPVFFLYAQEARPYSLWALTIVLASAALLRAARTRTWQSWLLYGLLSVLGLYSHFLHVLVLLAQGTWIAARSLGMEAREDRSGRRLLSVFVGVAALALVLLLPWCRLTYLQRDRIAKETHWLTESPACTYPEAWKDTLCHGLIDGWYDKYEFWWPPLNILHTILLGVGALLFFWACRRDRAWLFAFLLIGVPFAALAGLDLLSGGQRSTQARYLFPCHVGIMLAGVAVLLRLLESPRRATRVVGRAAAVFLIAVALASTAVAWQADAWWNKGLGWTEELQAVHCINGSKHPLVLCGPIAESRVHDILELGHLLQPHVRFRVVAEPDQIDVPAEFTDVFLVNLSDEFRERVESRLRLERMSGKKFWHCCE